MKKFSTIAAAAALAVTVAAPVAAEETKANVNADPFVSSQGTTGSLGLGVGAGTTAAIVAGVILVGVVAASGSDDAPVVTTTGGL